MINQEKLEKIGKAIGEIVGWTIVIIGYIPYRIYTTIIGYKMGVYVTKRLWKFTDNEEFINKILDEVQINAGKRISVEILLKWKTVKDIADKEINKAIYGIE